MTTRTLRYPSSQADEWATAPQSLALTERDVHIWQIDLTRKQHGIDSMLSLTEHERAARFHFEQDRVKFKTARAALRSILGRYLHASPSDLKFGQTEYGKPFLEDSTDDLLRFNLSHAGDMALLAVTRAREIGIDVELMRSDFATDEVAQNFFSSSEVAELAGLSPKEKTRAFFNCWTRKEAYVKALGEGLSMPLHVFDVTLAPDSPAAMLSNRSDSSETARWIFHHIALPNSYVGALVIEATPAPLHISRFQFCD